MSSLLPDERQVNVREQFDMVLAEQEPFLALTSGRYQELRERILDQWEAIQAIAAEVPPARELARLLEAVGGATTPGELGIKEVDVRAALCGAYYLRQRFTVFRLGRMLGMDGAELIAGGLAQ